MRYDSVLTWQPFPSFAVTYLWVYLLPSYLACSSSSILMFSLYDCHLIIVVACLVACLCVCPLARSLDRSLARSLACLLACLLAGWALRLPQGYYSVFRNTRWLFNRRDLIEFKRFRVLLGGALQDLIEFNRFPPRFC